MIKLFLWMKNLNKFFAELVDEDLTDDIACSKIVYARHGFTGKIKLH